jgi:replicative DNA helicase
MAGKSVWKSGSEVLQAWWEEYKSGQRPVVFDHPESSPMSCVELGPKLITLIGGAPASGKTAFVMQLIYNMIYCNPQLAVTVCNVEMPPESLLQRQIACLSGITLDDIRSGSLGSEDHKDRLLQTLELLRERWQRICFVEPPFKLEEIEKARKEFTLESGCEHSLLVLDYIQRIDSGQRDPSKRNSIDRIMGIIRDIAHSGVAVLAVSSISRMRKFNQEATYDAEANLASFKESGELEYGADDAFILQRVTKNERLRILRHLKSRNRQPKNVTLDFDGRYQRFSSPEDKEINP